LYKPTFKEYDMLGAMKKYKTARVLGDVVFDMKVGSAGGPKTWGIQIAPQLLIAKPTEPIDRTQFLGVNNKGFYFTVQRDGQMDNLIDLAYDIPHIVWFGKGRFWQLHEQWTFLYIGESHMMMKRLVDEHGPLQGPGQILSQVGARTRVVTQIMWWPLLTYDLVREASRNLPIRRHRASVWGNKWHRKGTRLTSANQPSVDILDLRKATTSL
jgi:hypothetical protein